MNVNSITVIGANCAGLKPKLPTFKKVISDLEPGLFFLQETKMRVAGQFQLEGYKIFEQVRETLSVGRGGVGGGLALGCLSVLKPVLVRDGGNTVEALSIIITVRQMKIRCCVAYGCQEYDKSEKRKHSGTF